MSLYELLSMWEALKNRDKKNRPVPVMTDEEMEEVLDVLKTLPDVRL